MDASSEPTASLLLRALRASLLAWGQHHVLACLDDAHASTLETQLLHFEAWYPGGIDSYIRTATRLFHEQQPQLQPNSGQQQTDHDHDAEPSDPFVQWVPTIPQDDYGLVSLDAPAFRELEAVGLQHAAHSAFVVVAGGLGERLGYDGIKLALPVETATRTSYIETYIRHIQALQRHQQQQQQETKATIPLAIMTSDATHTATQQFLDDHDYFGVSRAQITLLKQDTVPCLDAVRIGDTVVLHLVLDDDDASQDSTTPRLVMKPHGHGDVHTLLHTSGLARQWLRDQHKKYVHFIQDTNALILNSTLPLLGASVTHQWHWAFTVVPRKAKDASGAIVQFTHPQDPDRTALCNVEYHELDQFLRAQAGNAFRDGDANDPYTGVSPFPGNINHFVADLASYVDVLNKSRGKTPEIFNPKYRSDASGRGLFKSPARLECMMQDFPKLLVSQLSDSATPRGGSAIGFLSFPASLVYSPCKNDTASAATKVASDVPPQCACSAEHDVFALNRAKLEQIGVGFSSSESGNSIAGSRSDWRGIPVPESATGPHVAFTPTFAIGLDALARRFPSPSQITISNRSTLIVEGAGADGVTLSSLALDGALRITACEGAIVDVRDLTVTNAGFEYAAVDANVASDAVDAMRGYTLKAREVLELKFHQPGRYVVEKHGQVTTF